MGYYDKLIESDSFLEHHGIMGQKWGVRRYQNYDGSLTAEGREHYGQHVTKKGKFRASNGEIIAPARSKGVDLLRRASITPVGQVLSSAGTNSMSRMTGRSVDSIKDQSRREREALKEYFEMGGDKMLRTYLNEMNPNTVKNGKQSYEQAVREYQKDFGDMKTEDSKPTKKSKKSEDPIDKYFKENPGKTYEDIYKEMGVDMNSEDPDDYREAEERFKEKLKNTKPTQTQKKATDSFSRYIEEQTGGFDMIDDPELLDLLVMEYEEDTGKKAYR